MSVRCAKLYIKAVETFLGPDQRQIGGGTITIRALWIFVVGALYSAEKVGKSLII
jgi:hypothetical protein